MFNSRKYVLRPFKSHLQSLIVLKIYSLFAARISIQDVHLNLDLKADLTKKSTQTAFLDFPKMLCLVNIKLTYDHQFRAPFFKSLTTEVFIN